MIKIPSYRLQLGGIAVFSTATLGVLSFLVRPGFVGTHCGVSATFLSDCSQFWSGVIDGGFYSGFFLKAIIIASLLLMLLPEQVYKWWRWIALIAIPLAVWDIITTKTTLNIVGSSPKSTSNMDSLFFLSASLSIVLMALLSGKAQQHSFTSRYYRFGAYALSGLFSLGVGVAIVAMLFEQYL